MRPRFALAALVLAVAACSDLPQSGAQVRDAVMAGRPRARPCRWQIVGLGGRGASTIRCPACDPNAISVAASNWQDQLAYYSNWGTGLDLTAPGGQMYSNTSEESGIFSSIRGGYAYFQGTSMAAPQVTGTAGIVASVTGARGAALRSRLLSTADDLGAAGYDTNFGNGRLNSYRAVTGTTLGGGL